MIDIETAINNCDLALFASIPSQSSDDDKRTLLACQSVVRRLRPGYVYLEIGSHLGGSIQPHLLDPECARIFSIDKRPTSQPDERGVDYLYLNNSTQRMMEYLLQIQEDVSKVKTVDGDCETIDAVVIDEKVDLCFIDGEHTDAAVVSDFKFCLKVLAGSGVIAFHDSQIIYNGIARCLDHLEELQVEFKAYVLPNSVFIIEIGDFPLHRESIIQELLLDNNRSYLFALKENDHYRRFSTRTPFRILRRFRSSIKFGR